MPPKHKAKKKMLNLSGPLGSKDPAFEVSDYDYWALQSSKKNQEESFEEDLEYLIGPGRFTLQNRMVEPIAAIPIEKTAQSKKSPSARQMKVSVADITRDIAGLSFSSEDENTLNAELETNGRSVQKAEKKDPKQLNKELKQVKNEPEKGKKQEQTKAEAKDNASNETKKSANLEGAPGNGHLKKTPLTPQKEDSNTVQLSGPNAQDSDPASDPVSTSPTKKPASAPLDEESKERKRLKNARRRARRKEMKKSHVDAKPGSDTDQEEINRTFDAAIETSPEPSEAVKVVEGSVTKPVPGLKTKKSVSELKLQFEQPKESPFDVTLRPTKKQNANGTFTSESLPAVYPIKTLIGLSHQQVLQLELTDVKIKTIVSTNTISKFANNVLAFVTKHTDDLFEDAEKKTIFIKLCVNVALSESIGFSKTLREHSQIVEWFGGYDEINLATTGTKLTVSSKNIHQNTFDYSVLSYIGHILIWAAHQQRMGKVALFTDKFGIALPQASVRASIGGYHLWDRLIRESKGMNSKRWKHIIKFRQAFGYEEDQFMLILRFMKVDTVIP